MRFRGLLTAALTVPALVAVAGCGTAATPSIRPSARLIHVAGLPAGKIILSELGAQQIGLKISRARLEAVPTVKQPGRSPAGAKPASPTHAKSNSSRKPKPPSGAHAKPASPPPHGLVTVPYSAVVYAPSGKTYVFSNIGRLTYTEVPITINHISGQVVFLARGVKAGTPVVSVGAEELFGVQSGVLAQT